MEKSKYPYKSLLLLGLPLIGGNVAQFSLSIIDTAMLGHYNPEALAASVIAGSLFFVLYLVGGGFSFAMMPVVAACDSIGQDTEVRRATRMTLWLSCFYGVLIFPVLFWSKSVLLFLGQSAEISNLAQNYLRIMSFAMFPALIDLVFRNYLTGLKHTNIVLTATLAALLLKVFLSWILVFGNLGFPELGIRGAALSTFGAHCLIFVLFLLYSRRHFGRHNLFKNIWRIDTSYLKKIFNLGVPIGLTYLAESGLFSATAIMMGWLGTIELAAHGIALQLAAITFMCHLGLSQAATTLIGNAHGRKDNAIVLRKIGVATLNLTCIFSLVIICLFLAFPYSLLGMFIDTSNSESYAILEVGVRLIMIAAIFQLVDGMQAVGLALLRGIQDVKTPLVYAIFSYWGVGMTTGYILGFKFGLGAQGVWMGLVTGLTSAAICLLWRFWDKTQNL